MMMKSLKLRTTKMVFGAMVLALSFGMTACSSKSKSKSGSEESGNYDNKKEGGVGLGLLDRIYFDFDKAELSGDAIATLKNNAEVMKKSSKMRVLVEGHCDERGTNEYNVALGERRAKTALDYLVSMGVARSRLEVKSWGEERPVDLGKDDKAYSQNRRGEFVILAK